jgi:hypothetical protein
MKASTMVRVGLLGLIAWLSTTAYIWWQYHQNQDESYRPLIFLCLCGSAAWTLGMIIWSTVQDQEDNHDHH